MASMCRSSETPLDRIMSGLADLPGRLADQPSGQLGQVIIKTRAIIDRTQAIAGGATRRFEKAGGSKADGFLGMIAWLRVTGKLSCAAAPERAGAESSGSQTPTAGAARRGAAA